MQEEILSLQRLLLQTQLDLAWHSFTKLIFLLQRCEEFDLNRSFLRSPEDASLLWFHVGMETNHITSSSM